MTSYHNIESTPATRQFAGARRRVYICYGRQGIWYAFRCGGAWEAHRKSGLLPECVRARTLRGISEQLSDTYGAELRKLGIIN